MKSRFAETPERIAGAGTVAGAERPVQRQRRTEPHAGACAVRSWRISYTTHMGLWTLDTDGSVVVPTRLHPGRRFGGAILSLIGAWLGWQIMRGIRINHASTGAAWTEYIPAVLVFGGFALAFLLPGIVMLLYTRTVRFDIATREIADSRFYLGLRRKRVYPLSRFKTIVLARRTMGGGRTASGVRRGRTYSVFVVELAPATGRPFEIVMEQHEPPARDLATKLIAMTNLPLQDDVAAERVREERESDDEDDDA